jgi:hypothetical protein
MKTGLSLSGSLINELRPLSFHANVIANSTQSDGR